MNRIHAQIPESSLKTKNEYRDRIELLRRRVNLLVGKDRLMMTMYLENNNTFRQIGLLIGVDPANIGRRIRKVTEKLIVGEYIECLKKRDRFSSAELSIAKDYFLLGFSIRKIASNRKVSYYQIQQAIVRIKQMIID